ncbi:hypothetical protein PV664_34345 [Streptomyces sp. ME01-18a]|uniref:hypothetical protein n=1 Tax=Streptomyces sp. ME01-18a TaxID=3028669 RepID=UPI0029AF62D5|nr:hypothetical protein [Streptomyces sp. ME01-18a]MDX3433954.1 hypothetical protein [Streptomyces sp. ME01-18a]
MSAQPESPRDRRISCIPHTINAIADALNIADSARFKSEVLAAEESDVPGVMRRWWKTAMINRVPDAACSRANAERGNSLLSVDDLIARIDAA